MSRSAPRSLSLSRAIAFVVCTLLIAPALGAFPARATATAQHATAMAAVGRAALARASTPLLGLNPPLIQAGGETVVSGLGFAPGEVVIVRLGSALQGSISADSGGSFGGFLLTVPAGTRAGNYVVSAIGATSGLVANATLSVQSGSVPAARAAPAPGIAVEPRTSTPGGRVQVSGAGFLPGETVLLAFNGGIVQRVSAGTSGAFVDGSFVVPAGQGPNRYLVTAVGASSGRGASAVLALTVPSRTPRALFFATHEFVRPGSRLSVRGAGFAPGERVAIRLGSALLVAPVAGRLGTFSVTLVVPVRLGGYTITATGAATGRRVAIRIQVVRPVAPRIGLAAPGTVRRGGTVAVSGANFLPGEIVLIRFHGAIVQAVASNSAGQFQGARFSVPGNAPFGLSPVTIEGARSGRLAIAFLRVGAAPRVVARLTISSSGLHRGSTVTLSGRGFQAREVVLIHYRGGIAEAVQTDRSGAFHAFRFTIPLNSPYGRASIAATGLTSGRGASLAVTISPVHNVGISVRPGAAPRGSQIAVSGHGFVAGEIVVIRIDGILVAGPTADRHGSFTGARFVVPRQIRAGAALLDALGSHSERHAQTTLRIG